MLPVVPMTPWLNSLAISHFLKMRHMLPLKFKTVAESRITTGWPSQALSQTAKDWEVISGADDIARIPLNSRDGRMRILKRTRTLLTM